MAAAKAEDLEVWPIQDDIAEAAAMSSLAANRSKAPWEPLFLSARFLASQPSLELEDHTLKDRKLRVLGNLCTTYRKEFTEAAEKASALEHLDQEDGLQEAKTQAKKIRGRGSNEASAREDDPYESPIESTLIDMRRPSRSGKVLSI